MRVHQLKKGRYHLHIALFFWVLAGSALFCARQGFPPGGPEDKTPPQIIATYPPPNSIEVDTQTVVELVFSERMTHASVEEAIFVTPYPGESLRFKWRNKKLTTAFPQTLRDNRTYVITVGSDAKDLRNNRMNTSTTLAFSTGAQLDIGTISGRVYGNEGVEGIFIWAYDRSLQPSPDPKLQFADYITQSGVDGTYTLPYLAPGIYRVFAVMDKDRSQIYDPEYDALGIAAGDVLLGAEAPHFYNCDFRIAVRDTSAPRLDSATSADQQHLDVRFSERMQRSGLDDPLNYRITDSSGDTVMVINAYLDFGRASYLHLTTEAMHAQGAYTLTVLRAFDVAGLALDTAATTVAFSSAVQPDSIPARIISTAPSDSARAQPVGSIIEIIFSEAMDTASVRRSFALIDSLRATVDGIMRWDSPAKALFHPSQPLQSKMSYTFSLTTESVFDYFGNALYDSLVEKSFTTLNTDTLSAIRGFCSDDDSAALGKIFLHAQQVTAGKLRYTAVLEAPGPYAFEDILPGIYIIDGFRDSDGNGEYSFGNPSPFIPAERFFVIPDSISVRSRWPNEGNDVMLLKWKK